MSDAAETEPFRGADRRTRELADPRLPSREFVLAGLLLLTVTAAAFLVDRGDGFDARALNASAIAVAAVLAALAGAASILRWRLAGEAPALRAGVALFLLSIGGLGLGYLIPMLTRATDGSGRLADLGWAATATALALFTLAITQPEIDTGLRPVAVVAASLSSMVALAVVVEALPWLTQPARGSNDRIAVSGSSPLGFATIVFLVVLGIAYSRRGIRQERGFHTWLGLMFFGLALASVVRVSATSSLDPRVAMAALLATFAYAFALNGNARELAHAYASQRARRFDAELGAELADTRSRTERVARDERLHDTRSAIAAVQGAARVLEDRVEQLTPADRASLTSAIGAELTRIGELVNGVPGDAPRVAFPVYDVLEPLIRCQRALGRMICTEIPESLLGFGRPVAVVEIVQNLLDNAARHAPGSTIAVRARRDGLGVRIEVEDHGPGVPVASRSTIFARGVRAPEAGGTGLGLFVARRLAQDDGGDLWVQDAPGGGASFVLGLADGSARRDPGSAGGPSRRAEALHHPTHLRDVGGLDREDQAGSAG